MYLFLAVLGLRCCTWALVVVSGGSSLGAWASRFAEHGLSCPASCGIFLDQGSNLCTPYWLGRLLTTGVPGKLLCHLLPSLSQGSSEPCSVPWAPTLLLLLWISLDRSGECLWTLFKDHLHIHEPNPDLLWCQKNWALSGIKAYQHKPYWKQFKIRGQQGGYLSKTWWL